MKIKTTLLAMLSAMTLMAGESQPVVASSPEVVLTKEEKALLRGSLTVGAKTAFTGRGLVPAVAISDSEGAGFGVLQLETDVADKWTAHVALAYTFAGNSLRLYSNPYFGPPYDQYPGYEGRHIKEANMENEFVVKAELRYKATDEFSIGVGYDYIHGGMLGVMSKHFADNGASCVGEFFISPKYSPYKWLDLACPIHYSSQGIYGWWLEPSITLKAPLIGTPEDITVAGLLSFNMSATADYFQNYHGACANGSQAWWIQLSTPWFVNESKSLIITPSVGFHWLGKGAIRANKHSEYAKYTGDSNNVPFRNFAVVGTISVTWKF